MDVGANVSCLVNVMAGSLSESPISGRMCVFVSGSHGMLGVLHCRSNTFAVCMEEVCGKAFICPG